MAGGPNKDVDKFRAEVARHCKETGRRIAWEYGGSHIKVRDAETMQSILGDRGVPLTLPTSPGDVRTLTNCRAEFRRAGLLPKAEPKPESPVERQRRQRTLLDRLGRALRSDLAQGTRKKLLREVSELLERAA